MINIFYINLDGRVDRQHNIIEQMFDLGLVAQRLPASVGKDLTIQEKSFVEYDKFLCLMKRPITDGEIGCALSHRRIWQYILDNDLDYALIMEDDVIIDKRLVNVIRDEQNYQSFDFINLSTTTPYSYDNQVARSFINQGINTRPQCSKLLNKWKMLEWRNKWRIYKLKPISNELVICECDPAPALGSGYIISKKAAFEFLQSSNHLFYPIDYVWRFATGELKQGFMSIPLIVQTQLDSDIFGREKESKLGVRQSIHRLFLKRARRHRIRDVKKMYG
ncbi:glycosyltransferase family 25 protein [Psychrobacter sp. F1192]|uniref:Glycosyltransferase family 25 protein n=1 Tax=Psychrobacter coccoides TaxID=2818440 RepID=A0ABS3NNW5_9GAMM|nr:glycosyltransferase family 25 protein [Psychrobacter coccoides]MBO1531095.1 glycosyltransferase family 25 protein [Psychrobacter coccoides]